MNTAGIPYSSGLHQPTDGFEQQHQDLAFQYSAERIAIVEPSVVSTEVDALSVVDNVGYWMKAEHPKSYRRIRRWLDAFVSVSSGS
jgi:hypothetical protein